MSTSNATGAYGADPGNVLSALPSGVPDPALLEHMANAFFRAIPGKEHAPALPGVQGISPPLLSAGLPKGIPPLASSAAAESFNTTLPGVALPAIPGAALSALPDSGKVPTEAELAALPGVIPGLAPANAGKLGENKGAGKSESPGPVLVTDYAPPFPAFSFLQDARPLFSSAPRLPAVPVLPEASDAELEKLAAGFSESGTRISPGMNSELAAPQIAGVPSHPAGLSARPLGFLAEVNPLEPLNVPPSLAPIPAEPKSSGYSNVVYEAFDVNTVRRDFPILQERVHGRPLIWLDNAATTQKPQSVIDRISFFYEHENSNIHRAAHTLAARATDAYEAAREKVRRFMNASSARDIIFVRGATEGINLVAQSWGWRNIEKDDEIVITWLEHHANIVPWQMLCSEKGARLRVAPVDDSGQVILEEYEKLFGPRTKLAAFAQVSNALGTVTPVHEMTKIAHRYGAKVLVDGAQSVSHLRTDVQAIDCDFYIFSGHKVFAPTGIGVVYGKPEVLAATPPWQGGGNMIADVTFEKTIYQEPPLRFEAGTGNIADAVGLGAAIDYVERVGMENISRYEHDLLVYGTDVLRRIPGLHLIGTANEKASVLSFVLDGFKTEEVGAALNSEGIAVRSGHHCAQPILRRFGLESTVRPSLAFYNTCEEIDALAAAIWNLKSGRSSGVI